MMDKTTVANHVAAGSATRPRRARPFVAWGALVLALAAFLYGVAPRPSGDAGTLILRHAQAIIDALPPGASSPDFPPHTTWIAYPLGAAQWIAGGLSRAASRQAYLRDTASGWLEVLKICWAALAALAVVLTGFLAFARSPGVRSERAIAGVVASGLLLAGAAWAEAVAYLSPAVPASLLLLLFLAEALGGFGTGAAAPAPAAPAAEAIVARRGRFAPELRSGVLAGALVAWFPFLWPAVVLISVPLMLRLRRAGSVVLFVLAALVATAALQPAWLLHPATAWLRGLTVWQREGGWRGTPGAEEGVWAFLSSATAVGPAAVAVGLAGTLAILLLEHPRARALRDDPRRWLPPVMLAVVWLTLVLLPAAGGVRRPGAVQNVAAPLLALWAALSLATVRLVWRLPAAALVVAGVLLMISPLPGRVLREQRRALVENLRSTVAAELPRWIPRDALWLSDRPVYGAPDPLEHRADAGSGGPFATSATPSSGEPIAESAGEASGLEEGEGAAVAAERTSKEPVGEAGTEQALRRNVFVVPRDSRNPDRYDYVYWPRWFAGFRYVLLSSTEVRGNLAREEARAPRHFYNALESEAELVAEWGRGDDLGLRLYRVREDAAWRKPLTAAELAEVRGSPRLSWFINSLGSLYARAGDLETAELLFESGCAWDSASVSLRCNLGGVYASQGRLAEAATLFEAGLRREPRSFELLYNFGQICRRAGIYGRAEDLLRRAVGQRPDYAPAHYELARVFLAQEKKVLAMMALEHFVRLQAPSPARAEGEELLRQLRAQAAGPPRP